MPNIVALIYSSEFNESNYGELCKLRPDYMLPFGGRYRIIDFALSNLTNHDISRVILCSDRMLRSTIDHIGNGKSWELNRRNGGLLINSSGTSKYSEIETYYDTIRYFEDHNSEYVYIKNPMYINKEDITDAYEKMKDEDLDCLIFSTKTVDEDGNYLNRKIISSDENGKPQSVGINLGISDEIDLFLGSFMIKTEVFLRVLRLAMERDSKMSLLNAIFTLGGDLNIDFYREDKGFEIISDTNSFFDANLRLLDREVFNELFYQDGLVYTKSKDEPSTSYTKESQVRNSLIANGAIIKGQVENSIIFRGVTIGKGAVVKNSVIFQDTDIGDGAILNFVITDKRTKISKDTRLFGNRSHPFVTNKNEVLEKGN
ncbi:glucose-1-phosphate adenylyltransferase subunit GlgD [Anaerococcus sp. AGMB09787]|uniref:glucose-1-phosphate adenylyltransferase subunit GlgD n=1 Tax=Anaerococcus sp. AGMB09787 TaxID=2922869 RepID=UPI001FAFBC72|nr:glucose-1-phosphate adenylyltransferase subunit GlgD [Anaerococcus sp. AGMB09787]